MRILLIVVALVAFATAVDPNDPKQLQALLNNLKANSDEPLLSSGPEDDKNRLSLLRAEVASVNHHNADYQSGKSGWEAGFSKFSYMSAAEKQQHLGLQNASQVLEAQERSMDRRVMSKRASLDFAKRADEADYRSKLPAVKNQGGCGSCWAFGAMVALEYQVNRKPGSSIKSLSEQQFLDCVYEGSRDGCKGGWPTLCYTFVRNNANKLPSTSQYPYNGRDGVCDKSRPNGMAGFSIQGSKYTRGEAAVWNAISDPEIGVLSVAIGVINSFFSYKDGIYSETGCSSINHAVDIVGYGEGYYLVRNSWGAGWGDGGYIKMKRGGVNTCAIESYAHYPLVSGEEEESDDGDNDDNDDNDNNDDEDGTDEDDEEGTDENEDKRLCKVWKKLDAKKLKGMLSKPIYGLEECQELCAENDECDGCSCKKGDKKCQMNSKTKSKDHEKWTAYKCNRWEGENDDEGNDGSDCQEGFKWCPNANQCAHEHWDCDKLEFGL